MPETSATSPATSTAKGTTTTQELTRAQTAIARRTAESRAIVPDFTVRTAVPLDASHRPGGAGVTALVVRACALALREHPALNGAYRDARLERYGRVNVGVSVHDPSALVVPTVFDADVKDAATIDAELAALAARVRSGEITQPEQSGATFTVSDVGAFGVDAIVPVLVPPQAGILGVGAVRERIVAQDGAPVVRQVAELTLVCDHRAVYPADASAFLAAVAGRLSRGELS